MTKHTRIAMLVGLLFIVLFGIILTELTGAAPEGVEPVAVPRSGVVHVVPVVREPAGGPAPTVAAVAASACPPERAPEVPGRNSADAPRLVEVSFPQSPGPRVGAPAAVIEVSSSPAEPAEATPTAPARSQNRPPVRTYTVQKGDSLYRIAERFYGDGTQYKRLVEANADRISDPGHITAGIELVIPGLAPAGRRAPAAPAVTERTASPSYVEAEIDREALAGALRRLGRGHSRRAARPAAGRVYVVRRGDTLTKIARQLMRDGSPEAVEKLYEANKDQLPSPDVLPAGAKLVIPDC